jgi:hypothetical protein
MVLVILPRLGCFLAVIIKNHKKSGIFEETRATKINPVDGCSYAKF